MKIKVIANNFFRGIFIKRVGFFDVVTLVKEDVLKLQDLIKDKKLVCSKSCKDRSQSSYLLRWNNLYRFAYRNNYLSPSDY
jgi:hypothetical protein